MICWRTIGTMSSTQSANAGRHKIIWLMLACRVVTGISVTCFKVAIYLSPLCCVRIQKRRYNTASPPAKFPGVDVANYAIMTRRLPSYSHGLRKNHPHLHPWHTRLYCGIPFYVHSPSSLHCHRCRTHP